MTRGPRGLRREVHHARSSSPMPPGGMLSECLRDAGADLVSKASMGALQRTDISRAGLAGEVLSGPNELEILRAELEEKTRGLKTLQRHYESMSALLANDREELANLRRAHGDHERECHELQKKADAASVEAANARKAASEVAGTRAEAGVAEKRLLELQDILKDSRAQVLRLQESLRGEKSASQAAALQLQEARAALGKGHNDLAAGNAVAAGHRKALEEAESKLAMLEAQCAKCKSHASDLEGQIKVVRKEKMSLEADVSAAHSKCKLSDEKTTMQQLELQDQRLELQKLSELLEVERAKAQAAKQAQHAAEAHSRGMLAEAEANTQEARKHGQREITELQQQVAELQQSLQKEQALVASVRDELGRDAQSCNVAAAAAAAAQAREEAAQERLQKLQTELQSQKEENERSKRLELEKLKENLTANQRRSAEELQAQRERAIKALEEELHVHEARSAKQHEELAGKVGSLASERQRLAEELAKAEEKEQSKSKRIAELLAHELDLEAVVATEKAKAMTLEKSLNEAEAARKDYEHRLKEERARWAQQLRDGESHRAEGLENAEVQLNEMMAAKNEAEGALVAARREQAMLRSALEESDRVSKAKQEELLNAQMERDALQLTLDALREDSDVLVAERDKLQKAVAEANLRLTVAERDCDGFRAAKDAAASASQLALDEAAASAQAALAAEQDSVRKAEILRLRAEEMAASRLTAADELSMRVAEQEKRLGDAAKLAAELQVVRSELTTARRESADARDDAKRWGERMAHIESEHGTSCALLKRAEANLELLRSELEEAQADNQHLRTDLDLKEQRLIAKGG